MIPVPALKCWATFRCPYGTSFGHSAARTLQVPRESESPASAGNESKILVTTGITVQPPPGNGPRVAPFLGRRLSCAAFSFIFLSSKSPWGLLYSGHPKDGLRFISGCPDRPHAEALDPKKIPMRTA